jgi:hypothetical protein
MAAPVGCKGSFGSIVYAVPFALRSTAQDFDHIGSMAHISCETDHAKCAGQQRYVFSKPR